DASGERVVLNAAVISQLASLPEYVESALTRDYEKRLLPALGATLPASGDFYSGRHFDDSRFRSGRRPEVREPRGADEMRVTRSEEELTFGKREIEAGEVDIDKSVRSKHVSKRIPISRDDVSIDRHAIPADRGGKAKIREKHVHIPLKSEEVVVEKQPV